MIDFLLDMCILILKFYFVWLYSYLFHIISCSQCYRSIIQTRMINCNAIRCPYFILSAVRFTDIPTIVKFTHIFFAEFLENISCKFYHLFVFFYEWHHCKFDGSDVLVESCNDPRRFNSVSISIFFFIVRIDHSGKDCSCQSSTWFDTMWYISFSCIRIVVLHILS